MDIIDEDGTCLWEQKGGTGWTQGDKTTKEEEWKKEKGNSEAVGEKIRRMWREQIKQGKRHIRDSMAQRLSVTNGMFAFDKYL